ncbi:archaellin/type IV pilin N-terminal domain-containing protein [Halorubrum distributum]|uniref:Flagellin n=1 Tax=Halorubrum distributum TaxID=29283 RepID=A0A6B1IMX3_9EURY|nr:archaellin/type IV pilin N-terminal domain-containing protein [Halorubrum terrestre]MYL17844.1 flagellin [Halorubrum terrestre]MYL67562.1 flagellin [Halorubrum terrestre]
MFEAITDEEQRGQVGIGTLIVFIAMVLVAAIAAGVLINTAGFLQTQAEATGEESTSQVSDRLQVVSTSGTVNDTNQKIEKLTFIVATSPGSGAVDLNQTTVEFVGEGGQDRFEVQSSNISDIIGTSGDVLTDNSDRKELEFTISDLEYNGANLDEDERVTVTFTTASGASTVKEIRVPTTITTEDSSVRL